MDATAPVTGRPPNRRAPRSRSHGSNANLGECRLASDVMKTPPLEPRSVGLGMCIAGVALWIIALVVDAPSLSVILSILIFMGGAVMLIAARS